MTDPYLSEGAVHGPNVSVTLDSAGVLLSADIAGPIIAPTDPFVPPNPILPVIDVVVLAGLD